MTALMIVFMAMMAAGNDGQERVLTETDQLLCLEGLWKETFHSVGPGNDPAERDIIFNKTSRWGLSGAVDCRHGFFWVDEGQGKILLFENKTGTLHYHGIYKRETGRLVICFTSGKNPRPTVFQVAKNQSVSILKPTKLPK
jgi:hypothetical protein